MKRSLFLLLTVATTVLLSAQLSNFLQHASAQKGQKQGQIIGEVPSDGEYISPFDRHKLRISDRGAVKDIEDRGGRIIADYDSFVIVEADSETAKEMTENGRAQGRDDYNLILLNAGAIDTSTDEKESMSAKSRASDNSNGQRLHLIQFAGPIKPEWYQSLVETGVEVVTYIPNNAYLVYGDSRSLHALASFASSSRAVQWDGDYRDVYKGEPGIFDQKEKAAAGVKTQGARTVESDLYAIQLIKDAKVNPTTIALIQKSGKEPIKSQYEILKYVNIIVNLAPEAIKEISGRPDVVSIQTYVIPKLRDERQDQIMAGNITGGLPNAADYLAYLAGKGFTQAQFAASGFAVDVSDDGLENGLTAVDHPNLHEGGLAANPSRVVYNRIENSGGPVTPGRTGFEGHGNLNSHVIAGFVNFAFGSGFPHADAAGFRFGLGVSPFVKVGMSTIFNPGYTNPNLANLQSRAYADGARISSNSWGASTGGAYTVDSQAYDALTRDAQPASSVNPTAGNQEMVIVFAAGNDGAGANTVGSPGTAKNVICVGAGENVRSHSIANGGDSAAGTDGCGIGDTGADSANDIIFFSSRGPCDDGRKKPDISGPGTHVTGGVAQAPAPGVNGGALATFNAAGVCALSLSGGVANPSNFFPLGQQWYTTSSGTSHSTPAVAGAAALIRQHFINLGITPPSPAMTKATLMHSARYMTGTGANDSLWSNNQGMGEVNLNSFFDVFATTNILRDQVGADTFTASGQQRVFTGNVVDNTKPFRVTLAWTDAPGPTSGNAFVNNLDLEVTVGGLTYKGNVFTGANSSTGGAADTRNNVEAVFIPAGVTGPFVVRVIGTNIAGDGVPNSGGALDQDFALVVSNALQVDQPVIASSGATIAAESCSPADGAIDPGETVTVNVCLQNVGSLNSVNLVGTLQATGGVTSPSGPQTYGVLVAGGSAVCRSFTFTAVGSCGGTLTATLDLQDGASNLGTVTFTFNLGALSAPILNTYSTGNIAVAIPDNTTVEVPINVPDIGVVSDVNVRVRINHTFDDDLVISLVHPDGAVVPLATNRGGAGVNYGSGANDCSGTHTVFDDSAATSISAGTAPFVGSFRPESPLSALNGKPTNGVWKLRVADTATLDTGTIGCVQLDIGRSVFLCCPFTGGTPNIVAVPPATLTAESCTPANNAPDPNEAVTMSFPLQNNGTGSTTNLVATLQATGGVTFPSGPQNYGAVPPVGGPVSRSFTFVATGSCGGTFTATLQLQDGATNLGTVTFTITLGATVASNTSFSNTGAITIPNPPSTGVSTGAPSAPYPSTITVAGVTGTVTKVTVTLTNLNHTFPDDIDVLLVGPLGQKVLLMSDVGGTNDLVNVTLTLDDAAAASLPDTAQIVTGTFKPTNIGTGDAFPAPAPAGPYPDPQLLSIFNGLDPNGTWSLYVVDDLGGDSGNMAGGWSITLTTSVPVCSTACVNCTALTCPTNITQLNDPNQCGAVVTYAAPTPVGSGCGTITCNPASDSFFPVGTTTVTCTSTAGPQCAFTVMVNDTQPPVITCPANQTLITNQNTCPAPACQVANFTTTATDNCPGVVLVCNPPSGSCFPVGVTTATCTATDASGNTATCSFNVSTFDTALQDDSNPSTILLWNSVTGAYRFCCNGATFSGVGKKSIQGCVYTLDAVAVDKRVLGRVDKTVHSGTASIQAPAGTTRCTITDRNTLNDTNLTCQ